MTAGEAVVEAAASTARVAALGKAEGRTATRLTGLAA
jgi:hypothetical protein